MYIYIYIHIIYREIHYTSPVPLVGNPQAPAQRTIVRVPYACVG